MTDTPNSRTSNTANFLDNKVSTCHGSAVIATGNEYVAITCEECGNRCGFRTVSKSKMKPNVGMLRQWLNEDRITDYKRMVTNEQIERFLGIPTTKGDWYTIEPPTVSDTTDTIPQEWDKEFDEKYWWLQKVKIQPSNSEDREKAEVLAKLYNDSTLGLKDFIRDTIRKVRKEERERMREVLEGMYFKGVTHGHAQNDCRTCDVCGWNSAINEAIAALTTKQ